MIAEPKIFMRLAIRNGPLDLLEHWVSHYNALGIDGYAVTVQGDEQGASLETIRKEFEKTGKPFDLNVYPFFNDAEIEDVIMPKHLKGLGWNTPNCWVGHADLDELWGLPRPINEIVLRMKELGHGAFHGYIIDRVSGDGSLVDAKPGMDIREQYPWECALTASIGKALTRKVVIARGDVSVRGGHHYADGDSIHYLGGYAYVAHYKWRGGLIDRLKWGLANTGPPDSYWGKEALRFLDFFGANEKVPLADDRIGAKRVGIESPKIVARTYGFRAPSP